MYSHHDDRQRGHSARASLSLPVDKHQKRLSQPGVGGRSRLNNTAGVAAGAFGLQEIAASAALSSASAPGQRSSFSSLKPSSPNFIHDDKRRRSSNSFFRASLPPGRVSNGFFENVIMDPFSPRSKSRMSVSQASLGGSETTWRSSLEEQVDRRMSWSTADTSKSSRTSYDSFANFDEPLASRRPSIASRAASWDGKYHAPTRPTPLLRPQPLSSPPKLRNQPGEAFKKLPKEVLDVILVELRKLHLWEKPNQSCATCWMRDAYNLALTCKNWGTSATPILYESIWLIGEDSITHIKKKFKMKYGTRLKLLRRTLRGNPELAEHVRELKVPDMPEAATTPKDQEAYLDMVASMVMACPNLERLIGFYQPYSHLFSRLTYALSTRSKLTEQVWNIALRPGTAQSQDSMKKDRRKSRYLTKPMTRDAFPELPTSEIHVDTDFFEKHSNWAALTTLVIHCPPGGSFSPALVQRTINSLPSLSHLALSSISLVPINFLSALPPLKSLHLSKVSILPQDFSTFVTTASTQTLTSLTLAHLPLNSLALLARLLSNLKSLTSFTLIQNHAPCLPENSNIFLQPYLTCPTLRHLTWDILHPDDGPMDATRILAASITASGFPNLLTLKAPCDYDGKLQNLCRPMDRIELPSDKYANGAPPSPNRKDSGIAGITSITGLSRDLEGEMGESGYTRSLRAARRAAQARIELARLEPKFPVMVEDWSDPAEPILEARFDVGAFVGTVGSRIIYDLSEDVDGKDGAGVVVEDVLAATEAHVAAGMVCDGRWNEWTREGERRKKGWGMHRERVRWKPVEVKRLF